LINIQIIVTNYTNKLNFCYNFTKKLQKDCDCLRLVTSTIFIIRLHLCSSADLTNNMLISVNSAKWYILHVRQWYSVRIQIRQIARPNSQIWYLVENVYPVVPY